MFWTIIAVVVSVVCAQDAHLTAHHEEIKNLETLLESKEKHCETLQRLQVLTEHLHQRRVQEAKKGE